MAKLNKLLLQQNKNILIRGNELVCLIAERFSKLEVIDRRNRFKRFARDINTKESLISERVEPYSRKEWSRHKNRHFCFHVFNK